MALQYPDVISELYYRAPKENPSYGTEFPHDFPYDAGGINSLFDLNYFPRSNASVFPLIIILVLLFIVLRNFFLKKDHSFFPYFSLLLYASLAIVFFGALNLPSFLRFNTTLGLVKFFGLLMLFFSLFHSFIEKKIDIFKTRSAVPLFFYVTSLFVSGFFITNLEFFITDMGIIFTGLLFFYLSFYFFDFKNSGAFLRTIAYLLLVPAFIVLLTFVSKNAGTSLVSNLFPRYENFVFLFDLSRGRIFSIIDFEYFVPCIIFLFLSKKTKLFGKVSAIFIFILSFITILLVDYRYRFLTFSVGFLAILVAVKKYRAMLLKIFIPMFLSIAAFYLFISAFLGRASLLDRFLLTDYQNDVDSLRRRVVMLGQAWDLFTQFPIFGVGTGNYKDNVQVTYERFGGRVYEPFYKILQNVYAYPHNWFILVLAENGLVGFIILIWVLYNFFRIDVWLYRRLSNDKHLIFITLSVISWLYVFANMFTMMHNSLPMVIIFWSTRGMIEKIYYEKRRI